MRAVHLVLVKVALWEYLTAVWMVVEKVLTKAASKVYLMVDTLVLMTAVYLVDLKAVYINISWWIKFQSYRIYVLYLITRLFRRLWCWLSSWTSIWL